MDIIKELYQAALNSYKRAYAPYSHFCVGASILADDGNIYSGCNTENISYPCGSCAEQNAIGAMINGGGQKIKCMLVLADSKELITPCGACLQRIKEFSTEDTAIYLSNKEGIKKILSIKDLLPHAFQDLETN